MLRRFAAIGMAVACVTTACRQTPPAPASTSAAPTVEAAKNVGGASHWRKRLEALSR